MVDICIVVYRNYALLDLQFQYWDRIEGDFRFLICDNTPAKERRPIPERPNMEVFCQEYQGIDGEKHGGAVDMLVRKAESDIIGICDSDFFWLNEKIMEDVRQKFSEGCKCYGVELWYEDFARVNAKYPERAGWLAPCLFGMFIDRELALSETFVVTANEGREEWRETGWRMREKIIRENIPCHVITAIKTGDQKGSLFYGDPENPTAFHWVKGSSKKVNLQLPELLPRHSEEQE